MKKQIFALTKEITNLIKSESDFDLLVETINYIRNELHEISPFKNEPVDFVKWIKNDDVFSNDYNPNKVAPPEMQLLEVSILNDGYTQPIVTFPHENKSEVESSSKEDIVEEKVQSVVNAKNKYKTPELFKKISEKVFLIVYYY